MGACLQQQDGEEFWKRVGTDAGDFYWLVSSDWYTIHCQRMTYLLQMTVYVFFPVVVFYYFNLPGFFEKRVASKRVTYINWYNRISL